MTPADRIIAAVRARGSEPIGTGLRDAAHEAFHALSVGAKTWDRETVHRALTRKHKRAHLWLHEMQARAVEQAVCEALGEECATLDGRVFTSCIEAIKSHLPHADIDMSKAHAERFATTDECLEWVAKIIALGADEVCS